MLRIPFYDLETKKSEFAPGVRHLLYCQKGTMSRIHAHHLSLESPERYGVFSEPDIKRPVTTSDAEQTEQESVADD